VRTAETRLDRRAEGRLKRPGGRSLSDRLFAPVDIASLVYFRIAFGALMVWEVLRYFSYGWVHEYYIQPAYHFTYYGFDWVRPWPGDWMVVHFAVLGMLATLIAIGLWYRIATVLFFLGFTYVFLLEQARYLNHFYLISLLALLMVFVPAHRAFSLDSWGRSEVRSDTTPAWSLWILRIQLGVVYFFGGIAKLNADWLRGEPLRDWLASATDFPIIGGLFTEEWLVYLFAYGSLLLDLFAFPLLLWRRTRMLTFLALVLFHVLNARLFSIGIFPWLSIAASALFFPPDWPRRVFGRLGRWMAGATEGASPGSPVALPAPSAAPAPASVTPTARRRRITLWLLGLFVAVQVLVPLRHFVYPGEVSWTEEGHRFSWHMKLRDKEADARFFVTASGSGQPAEVDPYEYLTSRQYEKMSTRPYMILQFAHHLAEELATPGEPRPEVRAYVEASLNGRPEQLLIDPRVDLAAMKPGPPPADWIVPFGSDLELEPPLP
jgi:vitamin K-dependent gamma-carboxylase